VASPRDDELMQQFADSVELTDSRRAPSRLKAKIYSMLLQHQAESGPLMSLTESPFREHKLCVFEQLVQIAPVGETAKSLNICRVCHARILAERFENPPIYWPGCPYVALKNS
jgi:hypothetical protein